MAVASTITAINRLSSKAKRQYLRTLQVSRYCAYALWSSIAKITKQYNNVTIMNQYVCCMSYYYSFYLCYGCTDKIVWRKSTKLVENDSNEVLIDFDSLWYCYAFLVLHDYIIIIIIIIITCFVIFASKVYNSIVNDLHV